MLGSRLRMLWLQFLEHAVALNYHPRRFSSIILSRFFLNLREASLDKAGIPSSSIDSGSHTWSNMRFAGGIPTIGSTLAFLEDEDESYEDNATALEVDTSQSQRRSAEEDINEELRDNRGSNVLDA